MKLIIVDDSAERVHLIKSKLATKDFLRYLSVVYCESADCARRELTEVFDLMVLDVLIPKKLGGTPQAKNSFSLLTDVCDSKKSYIRPKMIIGLTADVDELGSYREKFESEAAVVLRGTLSEVDWLDRLMSQVESVLGSQKKALSRDFDKVLISVHGIRTYGKWQSILSRDIIQHSRSFEFIEIKYGFFDLISFYLPKLRNNAVAKESLRVINALELSGERDVYIIAHSFGTLIASHALKETKLTKKVKAVILCGSPLQQEDDVDHIVERSEVAVNECGTRDVILILARTFVPGLGDAGRVGFQRENSARFKNRYFSGGHGLYFRKYGDEKNFYERFWLRTIVYGEKLESFDSRRNYIGQDFVDIIIKSMSLIKPYIIPMGIIYGVFSWFR